MTLAKLLIILATALIAWGIFPNAAQRALARDRRRIRRWRRERLQYKPGDLIRDNRRKP